MTPFPTILRTPSANECWIDPMPRLSAVISDRRRIPPNFSTCRLKASVNKELVSCDQNMPIQAAAAVMSEHNSSSIFIRESGGDLVGVVTDNDLRKKVTATGYDILKPVSDIMTSPLRIISVPCPCF